MSKQFTGDLKKISGKQANKLINSFNGIQDHNEAKYQYNPVYILNDGRTILHFDTHAFVFDSLKYLTNYIDFCFNNSEQPVVTHILKDKVLYSNNFVQHEQELTTNAIEFFKLKDQIPSLKGIQEIDKIINRNVKIKVDDKLFCQILAYIGNVMINNLPDGKWKVVQHKDDINIFEPYIISGDKLFNPFFFIYRELYENLPEQNLVDLYNSTLIEIGK